MLMVWHRAATATAALHKRKAIARVLLLQVSQAYFVAVRQVPRTGWLAWLLCFGPVACGL